METVLFEISKNSVIALIRTSSSWEVSWILSSIKNIQDKLETSDRPVYQFFEHYGCFYHVVYDNFTFEDMKAFLEADKECGFIKCNEEIAYHVYQLSR